MPPVPAPRCPLAVRVATIADLPFIDALQKKHSKALGYFPTKQFEGYIEAGQVLIATRPHPNPLPEGEGETVGYVIAKDRYLKRDELGVIYQLCVAAQRQRGLIGAALIKAVFERAAYGCRLFCCWCAQDLAANHFWEGLGFIPLAFRTGSAKKARSGRVHIFWQRKINAEDDVTPYWYPFQTSSGAIREDRIVFPIPPGTHWKDVRPVNVPTLAPTPARALPAPKVKKRSDAPPAHPLASPPGKVGIIVGGRIKYVDRPGAGGAKPDQAADETKPPRKRPEKPPKPKYDPKYLAAARELRDRCLEHVNDRRAALPPAQGKYDVSRGPDGSPPLSMPATAVAALPAPAAA